jgi:hypothetical protein
MTYLNFLPADILVNVNGVWFNSPNQKAVSIKASAIDTVRFEGETSPVARITYSSEEGLGSKFFYASKLCTAVQSLITDERFLYISKENAYTPTNNASFAKTGAPIIVNRSRIVSVTDSGQSLSDGTNLSLLLFTEVETFNRIFVPEGISGSIINQPVTVELQGATAWYYINPLSLCHDIRITNHETGVTNVFHTPHVGVDWNLVSRYDITTFGGFMPVYENGISTFIYFFDNEGNLVDQIDGSGPGYQWGNPNYRYVWGADNEPGLSVLKIFDGKNVRTHEFPYLAFFDLQDFSESDVTKNLYIPVRVSNNETGGTELYISTPGGGLFELGDDWLNGDRVIWATMHPSSDKIIRALEDPENFGYSKLEVYNEDFILLSSLNLASYNVESYDSREYYGSNGNFYLSLYNSNDNTVPYVFISVDGITGAISSFTRVVESTDSVLEHYVDFDTYDSYNNERNNLVILFASNVTNGTVPSLDVCDKLVAYWIMPNSTGFYSYEFNDGNSCEYQNGSSLDGRYPMMITYSPGASTVEAAIFNNEGEVNLFDTGIAPADVASIITNSLSEFTLAQISKTDSNTSWHMFSTDEEFIRETFDNYILEIEGGTLAVLDLNDVSQSWAFTIASGGPIPFPTPTNSFTPVDEMDGGWQPTFGLVTGGKQVLVDLDNTGNVKGFYFLHENNADWVHVVNNFNDNGTYTVNKGNTRFFYTCENAGTGTYYVMCYNVEDGSLVSGISMPTAGPTFINVVGDRFSAGMEVAPGISDIYTLTKTGVVQYQIDANLGISSIAYNDSWWSWEND